MIQVAYEYSKTIGLFVVGRGRGFSHPVDLAIGSGGLLYVLNRGTSDTAGRMPLKRVTICTLDSEEYLGEFGTGGTGEGELMWPASIAADAQGSVFISDEALHRIQVFDSEGRFVKAWGAQGDGVGELNGPSGMAFDLEDNLLVVDSFNHRVQKFTRDGTYLGSWGRHGCKEGEFNLPWGISIDQYGCAYVADWRNDRLQKFDSTGRHLANFGGSGDGDGQFRRPTSVAVDADGFMLVADWGNERVQLLDREGKFVAKYRGEADLSLWARQYLDANPEELQARENADMEPEVDAELSPGDVLRYQSASVERYFWGPTAVECDGEGNAYVVDSCRHRIQVYRKRSTARLD